MQINTATLLALRTSFSGHFQSAFDEASPDHDMVATTVPSTTKSNTYGWMNKIPNMRKWIGDRHVHNLSESSYAIDNLPFELTIGVDRDEIEDDNLGTYRTLFQDMGNSARVHPAQLVYQALVDGFTTPCFDGQYFFDTDHPVIDEDGNEVSYSNMQAGAEVPWFLIATGRPIKPIIFQERKKPEFVARDNPEDPSVFDKKEFKYGIDSRCNVGYSLPFLAFGSKAQLNQANYRAARKAMRAFKGDNGRPLGIGQLMLVCGGTWESEAREILEAERLANGASNTDKGTAKLHVTPWLD